MNPAISVIMPLYNTAAYVSAAVESILAQSFWNLELVVVDDGSTDGCVEVVRAIADERIRVLSGYINGGPGAARNRGVSVARGKYLGFFESDDLAEPGMLAGLMEGMTDGCDIVSGWYEGMDDAGELSGIDFKPVISEEKLAGSMLFRNCIATSVLLMKRECIEGQKFDETLEPVSDFDLWARLMVAHKTTQVRRVLARYRTHTGSISHRKRELTDECMRRIYRRQLERLGVEAADEEIELHAQLSGLTFGTPKKTVVAAENWLLKLDEANAKEGLYPSGAFREILGERWYGVCHSAGENGFWTWRRFFGSPLSKWVSLTRNQQYHLLRLSARGAIKNLIVSSCY